jgi:hypothetical protein
MTRLTSMKPLLSATVLGFALAAVAGIFALYGRPDFLVMLANQFWACF